MYAATDAYVSPVVARFKLHLQINVKELIDVIKHYESITYKGENKLLCVQEVIFPSQNFTCKRLFYQSNNKLIKKTATQTVFVFLKLFSKLIIIWLRNKT